MNPQRSSDPDGDELLYRWDFHADGSWDTEYSSESTAPYTWFDDHSGQVMVEVSDGEYTDTATATVTVSNVAPTASIESVEGLIAAFTLPGEGLSFVGGLTDPGTLDTHSVEWDLGDGNFAEGLSVAHEYASAGEYTVTLTVTDDDGGVGTDTRSVRISTPQEAVQIIDAHIQALPDTALDVNSQERKGALQKKLGAVGHQLDAGAWLGAASKLSHDVLPKADGDATPGDWIVDPDAQADLRAMIEALISHLLGLP